MADTTALVALVVAGVALIVAAGQLTQQLMATAYIIRKCDAIVTGGLTKGAVRLWHWRQFRFTVQYQTIIFTLPSSVYAALGDRAVALRSKRNPSQGCWISFAEDLIKCKFILPEGIYVREESGDRIPDDLTVAPIPVDALTVMLVCIAMGMQVCKFPPTSSEIILSGGLGSIFTSNHLVLGTLLNYSVFLSELTTGFEAAVRRGQAVCHEQGIWANTVFGRFRGRSYRPEFLTLHETSVRKIRILQERGWKDGDYGDSIAGAACFMVFAEVDCYMTVPPSVVRPWCVYIAESIVKAHHLNIYSRGQPVDSLTPIYCRAIELFTKKHGRSSPYLPWSLFSDYSKPEESELLSHVESDHVLTCEQPMKDLVARTAVPIFQAEQDSKDGSLPTNHTTTPSVFNYASFNDFHEIAPSSYTSMAAAWEVILRADQCMHYIHIPKFNPNLDTNFRDVVDKIIATAISSLSAVGAPSRGNAGSYIED